MDYKKRDSSHLFNNDKLKLPATKRQKVDVDKINNNDAKEFAQRYKPKSMQDLNPLLKNALIGDVNNWILSRRETPLLAENRQAMCLVGPQGSGKFTLAKTCLESAGYDIVVLSGSESQILDKIYQIGTSCSLKLKPRAIIMHNIHFWEGFRFETLTKLLTLHEEKVVKHVRQLMGKSKQKKKKPKSKSKSKLTTQQQLASTGVNPDLDSSLDGANDVDFNNDTDSESDNDDNDKLDISDAKVNTESKNKSKKLKSKLNGCLKLMVDKSNVNKFGLSKDYPNPITCPIICTMVLGSGGKYRKGKPFYNFFKSCKEVKVPPFEANRVVKRIKEIATKEFTRVDEEYVTSLCKREGYNLNMILKQLEFIKKGGVNDLVKPLADDISNQNVDLDDDNDNIKDNNDDNDKDSNGLDKDLYKSTRQLLFNNQRDLSTDIQMLTSAFPEQQITRLIENNYLRGIAKTANLDTICRIADQFSQTDCKWTPEDTLLKDELEIIRLSNGLKYIKNWQNSTVIQATPFINPNANTEPVLRSLPVGWHDNNSNDKLSSVSLLLDRLESRPRLKKVYKLDDADVKELIDYKKSATEKYNKINNLK